jgi:hypothetical protein
MAAAESTVRVVGSVRGDEQMRRGVVDEEFVGDGGLIRGSWCGYCEEVRQMDTHKMYQGI